MEAQAKADIFEMRRLGELERYTLAGGSLSFTRASSWAQYEGTVHST